MFKRLLHGLRAAAKRRQFESELDAELADHIAKYTEELMAQGMAPEQARRRARREFGSVEAVKDGVRDSSGLEPIDGVWRNLRYALRSLRQHPAYAITAILTLALCIGANTAIFSVVDAMLFRPLPYPEPERVGLGSANPART